MARWWVLLWVQWSVLPMAPRKALEKEVVWVPEWAMVWELEFVPLLLLAPALAPVWAMPRGVRWAPRLEAEK